MSPQLVLVSVTVMVKFLLETCCSSSFASARSAVEPAVCVVQSQEKSCVAFASREHTSASLAKNLTVAKSSSASVTCAEIVMLSPFWWEEPASGEINSITGGFGAVDSDSTVTWIAFSVSLSPLSLNAMTVIDAAPTSVGSQACWYSVVPSTTFCSPNLVLFAQNSNLLAPSPSTPVMMSTFVPV